MESGGGGCRGVEGKDVREKRPKGKVTRRTPRNTRHTHTHTQKENTRGSWNSEVRQRVGKDNTQTSTQAKAHTYTQSDARAIRKGKRARHEKRKKNETIGGSRQRCEAAASVQRERTLRHARAPSKKKKREKWRGGREGVKCSITQRETACQQAQRSAGTAKKKNTKKQAKKGARGHMHARLGTVHSLSLPLVQVE